MNHVIDHSTARQLSDSVRKDLYAKRISEAQDKLSLLVQCSQDSQLNAEFGELRANYNAMLTFLTQGGHDDNRFDVQQDMARKTWTLLTRARRAVRLLSRDDTYSRTSDRLARAGASAQSLTSQWAHTFPSRERYDLQDTLFDFLWTSPMWSEADTALWYDFIQRQDSLVQQHMLGAVFLAMWEFPDPEKLRLTTLMAQCGDRLTSLTAITALVLVEQADGHELESLAAHKPGVLQSTLLPQATSVQVEMALVLASKADTELEQNEINHIQHTDPAQAIKAAMQIKLKYVRKRLAMGYDPNLTRMGTLHSSKFLATCSHWFLPFDTTHPLAQSLAVSADGTENKALGKMTQVSADCDIDKYTMCELINNNKKLAQSVTEHLEQAGITPNEVELPDMTLRHIVQNLYRFFTQSPVCHDVRNPFDPLHLLIEQERFRPADSEEECLDCTSILLEAAETGAAARILDSMATQYGESVRMLRLRGRCHESMRQYQKAYHCYTQATFLGEPDLELALHLFHCCEKLGKRKEMYTWLDKIMEIKPDNTTYLNLKATNLEQDGMWADALKLYYRLVYDDPANEAATESIARCELMLGNLESARKYLEKRMEMPGKTDWSARLLCAHLCLIKGNWQKAKTYYVTAAEGFIREENGTYADFLERVDGDRKLLAANNISQNDACLYHDTLWMAFIHGL